MFWSDKAKARVKRITVFVGWLFIYIVYLILGGYIISNIEKVHERQEQEKRRQNFTATLKKYNYSENDSALMEVIESAVRASKYKVHNKPVNETMPSWDVYTGIFFCNTLVTTIGYGNMAPHTDSGKIFCICFAIFGIAITGVVVLKIGGELARLTEHSDTFLENRIKSWIKDTAKCKIVTRITQLVIALLMAFVIVWIIPVLVLQKQEGWDFLTSTYFCFTTLTTIGLGDVVPGTDDTKRSHSTNTVYQLSSMLYTLIALAALSTIINIVGSLLKTISEVAKMKAEAAMNEIEDYLEKMKVLNNSKLKDMLVETDKHKLQNKNKNNDKRPKKKRLNTICQIAPAPMVIAPNMTNGGG